MKRGVSFLRRLRVLLQRALLLPLLPGLAWGPFTHAYINRRALEKAGQALASGTAAINPATYDILARHQDAFLSGANSADAISTYHLTTQGVAIYDYAHNYVPDNARGIPLFGYRLVNEWKQAVLGRRGSKHYSEKDFAVACGWLAHQIADWYAHYAPIHRDGHPDPDPCREPDGVTVFEGYSNAHRTLGSSFYPEVLAAQVLADHGLTEFFHDLLIRDRYGDLLEGHPLTLFETHSAGGGEPYNLLTSTSELYRGRRCRIPPDQIPQLRIDFETVLVGMRLLMEILYALQPSVVDTVRGVLDPETTGLPDYIERSAYRVVAWLFALSDEEIAALAEGASAEARYPELGVRDVPRAGTILFGLAHRLGSILDPELLIPAIRSGRTLNLRLFWGAFDLRAFSLRQLTRLLTSPGLAAALPGASSRAILAFLAELVKGRSGHLARARAAYRRVSRPVIVLPGPSKWTDEEKIAAMLNRREIRATFAPALNLEAPFSHPYKDLALNTLVMRINGYDVDHLPTKFLVTREWEDHKLTITCRLREPLGPGFHHLLLDVTDKSGISAMPLEKEIYVRPRGKDFGPDGQNSAREAGELPQANKEASTVTQKIGVLMG
ncbi:MAG: zinc dependent phospholipase C family protein, partial [Thermoanaerobacterales bacterium]|nr:zinc dependent phospholipase C family protein [Thermoanaerobacterales bacterium]